MDTACTSWADRSRRRGACPGVFGMCSKSMDSNNAGTVSGCIELSLRRQLLLQSGVVRMGKNVKATKASLLTASANLDDEGNEQHGTEKCDERGSPICWVIHGV